MTKLNIGVAIAKIGKLFAKARIDVKVIRYQSEFKHLIF